MTTCNAPQKSRRAKPARSNGDGPDGSYQVFRGPVSMTVTTRRNGDCDIIVYTFETATDEPVIVSFVDELPASTPNNIGFDPDRAPLSCQMESDRVVVDHLVHPEDESRLAIELHSAANAIADRSESPPKITGVEVVPASTENQRGALGRLFESLETFIAGSIPRLAIRP